MPPKKGAKKPDGIKNGKMILKPTLTEQQKKMVEKLASKINLNGFRW